jgi:hypothetical protein
MSRLMTAAVSQKGSGASSVLPESERTIKAVTRRSLSAIGIKDLAERSLLIEGAGNETIEAIGNGGDKEDGQCREKAVVEDRRDEDRNKNQAQDGEQVGDSKDRSHKKESSAEVMVWLATSVSNPHQTESGLIHRR